MVTNSVLILLSLQILQSVLSMKCHVCGNTELSSNKEFFAGKCDSESDLGSHENDCPWHDNQYCLKLKIIFNLDIDRWKMTFLEDSFRDSEVFKVIPEEERDEMRKHLQLQNTIFAKEGILRGCAKFNHSFVGNLNCTATKQNGVEITTCLCHQSDYCNQAQEMNYHWSLSLVIIFVFLLIT